MAKNLKNLTFLEDLEKLYKKGFQNVLKKMYCVKQAAELVP